MSSGGGDVVDVMAGTYTESPTLKAGGSTSALNTVTADEASACNPVGANHPSPVCGVTISGSVTSASFTVLNGFKISGQFTDPCVDIPQDVQNYHITNNYITICGSPVAGIKEGNSDSTSSAWATFGYISGNTISWINATPPAPSNTPVNGAGVAVYIDGDHHIIENNDFSHVIDVMTVYGDQCRAQ
jgi:hypothetical protein